MEVYYDTMYQKTSRRESTAIERITDPSTVTNYLCGYSLRICTLYLLWIHLVLTLSLLATSIIATTYVKVKFRVEHAPNNTLYTLTINNDKWVTIDAFQDDLDSNIKILGHKIAEMFFSWVILDVCITIMALFGVYLNKLLMMVPYFVPIFNNILWLVLLLVIEAVLVVFNIMFWYWVLTLVIVVFLFINFYRFIVFYSYFHMVGKNLFSLKPQYLTTHSPHLQIGASTTVAPSVAPADSEASSPIKSIDIDSAEIG